MTKADRLEAELARERKKMESMATIDQVESWLTYLRNIGEIAWVDTKLRSPRYGLAAHARKKEDEG